MCDTAIDKSATPILDYQDTRDEKLVKAHAGQRPTWFTLRPLDPGIAANIKSMLCPERELHAFMHGCTACTDHDLLAPDDWEGDGGSRCIRGRAIKKLPDQLWDELGRLVLKLGELTLGESPRFAAPVGSRVTPKMPTSTSAKSADSEATAPEESG